MNCSNNNTINWLTLAGSVARKICAQLYCAHAPLWRRFIEKARTNKGSGKGVELIMRIRILGRNGSPRLLALRDEWHDVPMNSA